MESEVQKDMKHWVIHVLTWHRIASNLHIFIDTCGYQGFRHKYTMQKLLLYTSTVIEIQMSGHFTNRYFEVHLYYETFRTYVLCVMCTCTGYGNFDVMVFPVF